LLYIEIMSDAQPAVILLADDDDDDIFLIRDSFKQATLSAELHTVEDGMELMDYLKRRGAYADPASAPRPCIILLDLNMPRKDGRQALKEIKEDRELKSIPVIVLTTSGTDQDVLGSYGDGAASFITKPVSFQAMCEVMAKLVEYWLRVVSLPACGR
jgi:two-component system response regulator